MTVTWWKRSMFLKSRTSKPTGSDNSPIKTHPRRHCYGGWKVHQRRNIRRNSIIHKFPLPMAPPTTFQERLLENPRETGKLCMQRNWPTMYASRRPYWLTPILPALTWNTVKFFSSSFFCRNSAVFFYNDIEVTLLVTPWSGGELPSILDFIQRYKYSFFGSHHGLKKIISSYFHVFFRKFLKVPYTLKKILYGIFFTKNPNMALKMV